jgi:hypothetical protein
MPAPPGGPEDRLAVELACALERKPLPSEEWKKKIRSIPPGKKGRIPPRTGTSVNWWWRATAVGAILGDPAAQEVVSIYLDEENDLDSIECYTALGMYFADNLLGKTALRDAFRFGVRRNENLARALDKEILQVHASLLILSTDLQNLAQNCVMVAGPRGGSAKKGDGKYHRGIFEYLVLRGAGWSDSRIEKNVPGGKSMVKGISGNNPMRAMTWIRHHVELLESSFQADAAAVWQVYQAKGKPGLLQFLRKGTRVPFRWIVTSGGVASVMEKNCNPYKAAKNVALKETGKEPVGFPVGAKSIGFVESSAEVDSEHWWVHAKCEGVGSFSHSLPGGVRILDVRLGPSGVQNLLAGEEPPDDEEDVPPIEPPDPGEEETQEDRDDRRWYERLLDWLKERF